MTYRISIAGDLQPEGWFSKSWEAEAIDRQMLLFQLGAIEDALDVPRGSLQLTVSERIGPQPPEPQLTVVEPPFATVRIDFDIPGDEDDEDDAAVDALSRNIEAYAE